MSIPRDLAERLRLHPRDIVELRVEDDGSLRLIPQTERDPDQAWYWTEEWQEGEREVGEARARGEPSGPLSSGEELRKHLRSLRED